MSNLLGEHRFLSLNSGDGFYTKTARITRNDAGMPNRTPASLET
jgi:hypothetical protein